MSGFSFPRRWVAVLGILLFIVLLPFAFFGDTFDAWFSLDKNVEWMQSAQGFAWILGIGLLIADILLPVPGTVIMSSLGYVYGFVAGGLIAAAGSFLSGLVAYWLCAMYGEGAVRMILSDREYQRGAVFFDTRGPIVIVLTRWLPVLSEVGACMAGLTKMDLRKFLPALATASLPLGFIFAGIGSLGTEQPALVIVLNILTPLVLWLIVSGCLLSAQQR